MPVKYLLSGDVKISIEWSVDERVRYESISSPDVDNIIKLILDALSGPKGLIIDDCQVQSIECYWIDNYTPNKQHCLIEARYFPGEWVRKKGLAFVEIEKGLCMPINKLSKPAGIKIELDAYARMMKFRNKAKLMGASDYDARLLMSVQRVFHKSRLRQFEVYSISQMRALLNK